MGANSKTIYAIPLGPEPRRFELAPWATGFLASGNMSHLMREAECSDTKRHLAHKGELALLGGLSQCQPNPKD